MKLSVALVLTAAVSASACERGQAASKAGPSVAPAKLNLLIERQAPLDPIERAKRALEELRTSVSMLPSSHRTRFKTTLTRIEADTNRVLARLHAQEIPSGGARGRLQLQLRAVPLSLSLLVTDVAFDLHRDQLPEEAGHELSHAAVIARQAWIELARQLEANEA